MSERTAARRRHLAQLLRMARRGVARVGTALGSVAGLPFYGLSGLVRRDPQQIVFGGNGDRYTDNARYLFEHMACDRRFVCTWITGDRCVRDRVRALGHPAELRWSAAGVRAVLRAGTSVYGAYPSDVNFWLSRGAQLVNLWHGVPLKAIEFDIDAGPLVHVYRSKPWSPVRLAFLDRFVRPDVVVSTSREITQRCFASAFRVGPERCIEAGYPRTDHLFRPVGRHALVRSLGLDPRIADAGTIIGYFPTWRDDGRDFLSDAGFSFDELDRRLAGTDRVLVFKAHPNFGTIGPRGSAWSNVVVLPPTVDLNEVLPLCDVLVTDYSSVAFDYLLLDRPILYFLPDHDRYLRRRNLYFELEDMTAGPILLTSEALHEALAGELRDTGRERRRALRARVWGDYRGGACNMLADLLAGDLQAQRGGVADARSSTMRGAAAAGAPQ